MLLMFDCDGVVLDSMLLHSKVEAEVYAQIGIQISPEELIKRFSGISQDNVSRTLEKETGIKIPADIDDQIEKQKKIAFTERLRPMPGIVETLRKTVSIPRCIASGTGSDSLNHMLNVTNLYDCFAPNIFSSEMVSRGKPFPDLFLHAAGQMNHSPEDCLVIEDGDAGVRAAIAAGMRVFGFVGGSHCDKAHEERLAKLGAELVFSDMHKLPELINLIINQK